MIIKVNNLQCAIEIFNNFEIKYSIVDEETIEISPENPYSLRGIKGLLGKYAQ